MLFSVFEATFAGNRYFQVKVPHDGTLSSPFPQSSHHNRSGDTASADSFIRSGYLPFRPLCPLFHCCVVPTDKELTASCILCTFSSECTLRVHSFIPTATVGGTQRVFCFFAPDSRHESASRVAPLLCKVSGQTSRERLSWLHQQICRQVLTEQQTDSPFG